ncbi:MAG: hypothetical protein IFK92_04470 [Acidobacteria bacterium]|nr:hypothetical protein [Candidatus Sulfomarinibacter kjeldsenii]
MNTMAIATSAIGFVAVMVAWISYLATIPSGKVPARPVGSIILQLAGMVAAASAVVWSFRDGGSPGVAVVVPAVFALMMGSTFMYLLSLRKTPIGNLKVKVGEALLRQTDDLEVLSRRLVTILQRRVTALRSDESRPR